MKKPARANASSAPRTPPAPPPANSWVDPEIAALHTCMRAVADLPVDARHQVVGYLYSRFLRLDCAALKEREFR